MRTDMVLAMRLYYKMHDTMSIPIAVMNSASEPPLKTDDADKSFALPEIQLCSRGHVRLQYGGRDFVIQHSQILPARGEKDAGRHR